MLKNIKNLFAAGAFILFVASPVLAVASPVVSPVSAAASCEPSFLGIPPWYRGLTDNDCSIITPTGSDDVSSFIWKIVLNVIEMALVLVVYIAVFFIIYGGFLFMTGGSNPSQVEKARKSILNAVVGLVIAMGSIAIVKLIFGIIS